MKSVSERFEYRAPGPGHETRMRWVRDRLRTLARELEEIPMDARCRALAITKLEEALEWAMKGIVFAEEGE